MVTCAFCCALIHESGMLNTQSHRAALSRVALVLLGTCLVFGSCHSGSEAVETSVAALTSPFATAMSTKLGTFVNGAWALDVNGNGVWDGCAAGQADRCLTFGQAGDQPIIGAWAAAGASASIGIYRPSTNTFVLDLNGNGAFDNCTNDRCYSGFIASQAGDIAVAGDWQGTGQASIGLFRAGQWFLDWDGNGVWGGCGTGQPDRCGSFGQAGDAPVVIPGSGGPDRIGVFRSGSWFLDTGNLAWDGCAVDQCQALGQSGDKPVVGNWHAGITASVGVFRSGQWFLDANANGVWDGCTSDDCVSSFGVSNAQPVAALWPPTLWSPGADQNLTSGLDTAGAFSGLWETSAAALSPGNSSCAAGRVFIGVGSRGPQVPAMLQGQLSCSGASCTVGALTDVYPTQLADDVNHSPSILESPGTDNVTFAINGTGGGGVFHARLGGRTQNSQTLVGAYTWKTTDCGNSWTGLPFIDTSAILNGRCALHQGRESIGVFRPSTSTFLLDRNDNGVWDGCGTDTCISNFVSPAVGDLPVTGDWVGDGPTAVGIFRNGSWFLDANGNGTFDGCGAGQPDRCATFGQAGDRPFAVRAAGTTDFRSHVGVMRPNGDWFFDANGNGAWDGCGVDFCGHFGGQTGDQPAIGSWGSTGVFATQSKIGIFRSGNWILDKNGDGSQSACGIDTCINGFGVPSATAVTGVFRPTPDYREQIATFSAGNWAIDQNDNGVWDGCAAGQPDRCAAFGSAGDIPLVGSWGRIPGGFDRIEGYNDGSNGVIYLTAGCDYRDRAEVVLLSSKDQGQTWAAQSIFGGNDGPTPMMITSTLSTNTVYLFSAWGPNPILFPGTVNVQTGAVTLKPYSIVYQQSGAFPGPGAPAGSGSFPDLAGGQAATLQGRPWDGSTTITHIGRVGTVDRLRATYASVVAAGAGTKQVLRVMEIDVDVSASPPKVTSSAIGTIAAATASGSVTQAAMIDAPFGRDGVLISWKEPAASASPFGAVVERAVVARDRGLSTPFSLSRAAAGTTRSWDNYAITGDYIKGAAFTVAGQTQFFSHWIETPSGSANSIHGQVISTIEP